MLSFQQFFAVAIIYSHLYQLNCGARMPVFRKASDVSFGEDSFEGIILISGTGDEFYVWKS